MLRYIKIKYDCRRWPLRFNVCWFLQFVLLRSETNIFIIQNTKKTVKHKILIPDLCVRCVVLPDVSSQMRSVVRKLGSPSDLFCCICSQLFSSSLCPTNCLKSENDAMKTPCCWTTADCYCCYCGQFLLDVFFVFANCIQATSPEVQKKGTSYTHWKRLFL